MQYKSHWKARRPCLPTAVAVVATSGPLARIAVRHRRAPIKGVGAGIGIKNVCSLLENNLVLSISIPALPPAEFSGNSRAHYHARHAAGLEARAEVKAAVNQFGYKAGVLDSPVVAIRWGLPTKVRRDWDNLIARTKPYIDSLVDAGVLRDDSIRDYQPQYGWFDSPRKPLTEIRVYAQGE